MWLNFIPVFVIFFAKTLANQVTFYISWLTLKTCTERPIGGITSSITYEDCFILLLGRFLSKPLLLCLRAVGVKTRFLNGMARQDFYL